MSVYSGGFAPDIAATYDEIFKDIYDSKGHEDLWSVASPTMSQFKKIDDLGGERKKFVLNYSGPSAGQHWGINAQNAGTSSFIELYMSRAVTHSSLIFEAESMWVGKKEKEAFMYRLADMISDHKEAVVQQLCVRLLGGDSNGWVATIPLDGATNTGTNVVVVQFTDGSAIRFDVNDVVNVDNAANGESPINDGASVTTCTVSAVDPGADTITLLADGASSGATLAAAIDTASGSAALYIHMTGDKYISGSSGGAFQRDLHWGLRSWIPLTAPTGAGDDDLGVDRTPGGAKLFGHRLTNSSQTIAKSIQQAAVRILKTKSGVKHNFKACIGALAFEKMASQAGSSQYQGYNGVTMFGASSLAVGTVLGNIEVIADPWLEDALGYVLDLEACEIHHSGPMLHVANEDGQNVRLYPEVSASQMKFFATIRNYCNLFIRRPGNCAVFPVAL